MKEGFESFNTKLAALTIENTTPVGITLAVWKNDQ